MAAFSDFLENQLLEIALGQSAYQIPTLVRVSTLDDTSEYTVTINGTDYDYPAVGGDVELDVLTGLKAAIDLGGEPLTTTLYVDGDGADVLKIAQDATYAPLSIEVSATLTGVLTATQEVYGALYTSAVGDDNSGTEVVNAGYDRKVLPFDPPALGVGTLNADVVFGPAGVGGFGVVTHAALFDSYTGGNLLFHGELVSSKTVLENDTFTFRSGDLSITLA